jgi:hypothetical protein
MKVHNFLIPYESPSFKHYKDIMQIAIYFPTLTPSYPTFSSAFFT